MKYYFIHLWKSIRTTWKGLRHTSGHVYAAAHRRKPVGIADKRYFDQSNGLVTLTYPFEKLPLPDHSRLQLHNEIDDCIVCDKCAVVCPVNCIEIEPIKSPEVIGYTSDGSAKRLYAAKFNIDMAKCCYCGLCTSVCPTECLTMNDKYDYSVVNIKELNFAFSNLTDVQIEEKRALYDKFVKEKEALKSQAEHGIPTIGKKIPTVGAKPSIKIGGAIKPKDTSFPDEVASSAPISSENSLGATPAGDPSPNIVPKPAGIKPMIKPVIKKDPNA